MKKIFRLFYIWVFSLLLLGCYSTSVFAEVQPSGESITTSDYLENLTITVNGYTSISSTTSHTYTTTVTPSFNSDGSCSFSSTVFSSWGSSGAVYKPNMMSLSWGFYANTVPQGTKYFEIRVKQATSSSSSPTYLNYNAMRSFGITPSIVTINNGVSTTQVYSGSQSGDYMKFVFSSDSAFNRVSLSWGSLGSSFSPYYFISTVGNNYYFSIKELSYDEYQNQILIDNTQTIADNTSETNSILDTLHNMIESNYDVIDDDIDETNSLLDTVIDTLGDTIDSIVDVKDSILDLPNTLSDMLLGLFVPDSDTLQEDLESFQELFEEKLGFVYETFDYLNDLRILITSYRYSPVTIDWTFDYYDNGVQSVNMFHVNESTVFGGGLFALIRPYIKVITSIIMIFWLFGFAFRTFNSLVNPTVSDDNESSD